MSSPYAFGVHAFGSTIRSEAECSEAFAILNNYIFPSLPRIEASANQPDISIHVGQIGEEFRLSVNGVVAASAVQPILLVPPIINALDTIVIQRLRTLHAVHAGAVKLGEHALLLPGASHAGKSSLVAELLKRGATYLSDEYALMDSNGCVHSYPRPLLLRNGRPDQFPLLPSECDAFIADEPIPVRWILSLRYQASGSWQITAVPQGLAMLDLLRNTPHALADSPGMVASFRMAVAQASCYSGTRNEASHAAAEIFRLVEKFA